MAAATFIHDGNNIDCTPDADVSAGDVVVQGGSPSPSWTPTAID